MKSVYAYIRVSTVKQGQQGSSLTEQRYAIEEYAKRHNLSILQWFEERETAAKRGRTMFTQMLGLLLKGRANGVIIHKIDRGARNLKDWADLGGLIDKGIEVHFAHESLDMQSRGGRLAADIQAVVAADFIRNLREEVKKGFRGRLRQGLYPLPAPLGYLDQGRGLPKTPNPVAAPLIQKAFQMYATGEYNIYTLGEAIFKAGLRNKYGARVSRSGISKMLNNEFYIGVIHIVRTGERFQGIHEPLIKKSVFDKVQDVLQGRVKNTGLKHEFLYRKMIPCIHCKYNLIPERQKGIVYYRCQTRDCPRACVREDLINKQIVEEMGKVHMPECDIAMLESEFSILDADRLKHHGDLIKAAELNVANVGERIQRLVDAYIDRLIDKSVFEERNKSLLHERAGVEEVLSNLRYEFEEKAFRTKKFLEQIKSIPVALETINEYENRDLMKSITSNLEVDGKKLVVTWKEPFDSLASSIKSPFSDLHRATSRTSKKSASEFATELYKKVHDEKPSSESNG